MTANPKISYPYVDYAMLRRSATSFESIVPDKDEKIYEK